MKKQYYKCLKVIDGKASITYWHTSNMIMIVNAYDFIIPLGTRKPKNIRKEDIRE